MLERLLFGLVAAVIGGVAAAAVIHKIRGIITRKSLTEEARRNGMNRAVVDAINHCSNTVKLTDLNSGEEEIFEGDAIASDVKVGITV